MPYSWAYRRFLSDLQLSECIGDLLRFNPWPARSSCKLHECITVCILQQGSAHSMCGPSNLNVLTNEISNPTSALTARLLPLLAMHISLAAFVCGCICLPAESLIHGTGCESWIALSFVINKNLRQVCLQSTHSWRHTDLSKIILACVCSRCADLHVLPLFAFL